MPLVTTKEMFRKAYDGGYAIGAFNVNNMEIVQGITEACAKKLPLFCRSPRVPAPTPAIRIWSSWSKRHCWIARRSPSPCIWTTARILRPARPVSMEASPPS